MNIKSGQIDQFEAYSQFKNLTEFNHHMEMWLADKKKDFSKGELVGLKRLVRFAAKIPGVANAKIGTVLKAIHDEFDGNGISRSTFKRMIQKAQQLGILFIYETERKNGSQSSNLYVFQRYPISEPPKEEKLNHPKTNDLLKTEKINDIKERNETSASTLSTTKSPKPAYQELKMDHTFVNERIPRPFVHLVKALYDDAKKIEEFWRMAQIAAYRNLYEHDQQLILHTAIHAFKQLFRKIKLANNVRNPIAYFFGVMDQFLTDLYYEQLYEKDFEV